METRRRHSSYAFSTTGSGYAAERSALYGRGQAISWHSCLKMGVSCLQQHVSISPTSARSRRAQRRANKAPDRRSVTGEAAILSPFSSITHGAFHRIPHVREKTPGKSKPDHPPSNKTQLRRVRQREAGAGYSLVRRAGYRLRQTLDRVRVFGVSGSCCCLVAEAATAAVGSLSNWVEFERGPAPQERPRWSFLFRGRGDGQPTWAELASAPCSDWLKTLYIKRRCGRGSARSATQAGREYYTYNKAGLTWIPACDWSEVVSVRWADQPEKRWRRDDSSR